MTIKPLHNHVVVKQVDETETMYGNIIVPDAGKEKPLMGEIIATGPGIINMNGILIINLLLLILMIKVNKAVSVTMGPFGRNVLIEKEHGQVASTKDGVTVSRTITLEDPIENMAAIVIKQAAEKTVNAAGDGTTTSTVLAHSIASQALDATSYPSTNSTQVKRGIEQAVKDVVAELKKISRPIESEDQIKQIATFIIL